MLIHLLPHTLAHICNTQVFAQVRTVPSESVLVSRMVYVFTVVYICTYTATAIRLVSSILSMVYDWNMHDRGTWFQYFWTAYECMLLAIVLCALFAVADRWKLMERTTHQFGTNSELSIIPIVLDMCRVHTHVISLASVTVALTLFRVYRMIKYTDRLSPVERTVRESGATMMAIAVCVLAVAACTCGSSGYEFLNTFIVGQGVFDRNGLLSSATVALVVYVLLYTIIVSVFIKYYVLSKMHLRPMIRVHVHHHEYNVKHEVIHRY